MDARISDQRGNNAAYDIFSWDQVTLVIENACGISTPTIKSDLQSILLEALKRKDEKDSHPIVNDAKPKATIPAPSGNEISVKSVWEKLKRTRGDKYLDDVYQDESWNPFITQLKKLGESTGAGELKIAYVNQDESTDCFLIPKKHPIIIRADAKCPRDQIIRSLSN
jgi:hypothetical protein